jgi:hypothetical protein
VVRKLRKYLDCDIKLHHWLQKVLALAIMDFSKVKRTLDSALENSRAYIDQNVDIDSIQTSLRQTQHHCKHTMTTLSSHINTHITITPLRIILLALLTTFLTIALLTRRRQHLSQTPSTPSLEKASPNTLPSRPSKFATPARKPGTWTPSTFHPPTPPPYPDWNIHTTKPLPYRPFRHGPNYHVTMGLRTLNFSDWIELDNHFPRYHADKSRRITECGATHSRTAPEALPAALELLDELTTYLPARYPTLYRRTETGLLNLWNNESIPTLVRPCPEDPMQCAARLIQDDVAIMLERPDGQYYLLAASILLAGFWRLSDKFGMPLSLIHTSGDVPQFREKLEKGMLNFFRRLKPEELVGRNNYFLQVDDSLPWSHSIGPETVPELEGWKSAEKNRAISHHYFRSERQTLRRLPKSGGVVFTIRTYFEKVTDICEEDFVPGRLASAVRSWGEDVSRYKGRERYEGVLLEYLDGKHGEQVRNGLRVDEEEERRSYPW